MAKAWSGFRVHEPRLCVLLRGKKTSKSPVTVHKSNSKREISIGIGKDMRDHIQQFGCSPKGPSDSTRNLCHPSSENFLLKSQIVLPTILGSFWRETALILHLASYLWFDRWESFLLVDIHWDMFLLIVYGWPWFWEKRRTEDGRRNDSVGLTVLRSQIVISRHKWLQFMINNFRVRES